MRSKNIIIGSGTSAIQLISVNEDTSDDTRKAHFGSNIPVQIDNSLSVDDNASFTNNTNGIKSLIINDTNIITKYD